MSKSTTHKVASTAFSRFVRHASVVEKQAFFQKIVKASIEEQQRVIDEANKIRAQA